MIIKLCFEHIKFVLYVLKQYILGLQTHVIKSRTLKGK